MFLKNLMNDFIIYKLQEIIKLHIIQSNKLDYETKRGKT